MDHMEDSGFDSDPKQNEQDHSMLNGIPSLPTITQEDGSQVKESTAIKGFGKKSDLQKKLERQREVARRSTVVDQQPKRTHHLPARSRLIVPTKKEHPTVGYPPDTQPLVMIDTDESEDEFEISHLSASANREIAQQLIKDGYNLDLEPDDEDLDLIPPRPLNERCNCCQPPGSSCIIQ